MYEKKIHFTRAPYKPHASCQWDDSQILQVTEDISEVTCRHCLNALGHANSSPTLEEMRVKAQLGLMERD